MSNMLSYELKCDKILFDSELKILKPIKVMDYSQWVYGETCMPSVFEKDVKFDLITGHLCVLYFVEFKQ